MFTTANTRTEPRRALLAAAAAAALVLTPLQATAAGTTPADALAAAAMSPARPASETARDRYRHPVETLRFFGVKPTDTVVEIWPAPGYYAEILAPYLKDHGHYIAAGFVTGLFVSPSRNRAMRAFAARFADQSRYGRIEITELGPAGHWQPAAAGSADLVLSFRNVHNWIAADDQQKMFDAFYGALKPGGVLGLVEHRGWPGETVAEMAESGYVPVDYVKQLAAKAGFRFVAEAEINANPKDGHHYPKGVWTLPPTLALGDQDRAKYLAIGESDRMTLKFVKPR
ncbi:MAG: class I SAM-dependent methyltransferase [Gammaproteobacteria bacterium]|nr:class I SAM-dependent methyltransferase [Gammaproteobacteria bacterium]